MMVILTQLAAASTRTTDPGQLFDFCSREFGEGYQLLDRVGRGDIERLAFGHGGFRELAEAARTLAHSTQGSSVRLERATPTDYVDKGKRRGARIEFAPCEVFRP
jgi:GAF domain-containing protein